jgi:IMP dehydrogenase
MLVEKGYTFDDLLLIPKLSNIKSRSLIDISVQIKRGMRFKIPIVCANMKHVTGVRMARTIAEIGGLALLHRFGSSQLGDFREATRCGTEYTNNIGVSVGIKPQDKLTAEELISAGAKIVCVDVAHGHHKGVSDMVNKLRKHEVVIIAGNVATSDGAKFLLDAGAHIIKCGIGPGSLCTTRTETGNGVPQLTALEEVKKTVGKVKIIADGGIRTAGDITKALCFADFVMLGNLLAGTSDSPGDVLKIDDKRYKRYAGSSTHKTSHVEGVSGLVEYKGETKFIIERLLEGLRSGMSYQGAANLSELKKNPKFVSISHAGLTESRPHDVWVK